jgi:hypothetical protein
MKSIPITTDAQTLIKTLTTKELADEWVNDLCLLTQQQKNVRCYKPFCKNCVLKNWESLSNLCLLFELTRKL